MAKLDESKPGIIQRFQTFIQEVKMELSKVTWPTMDDLKVSTKVTMLLLGIMAGIIFVYDQVFQAVVFVLLKVAT